MSVLTVDVQQPREARPASRIEALIGQGCARSLWLSTTQSTIPLFARWRSNFGVSASHLLIAGFGQVLGGTIRKSWKPYLRLAVRASNFVLFLVLNVTFCIILERNFLYGILNFPIALTRFSVQAMAGRNLRSAVPIAYFLLFAPALLLLRSRVSGAVIFFAEYLFLYC